MSHQVHRKKIHFSLPDDRTASVCGQQYMDTLNMIQIPFAGPHLPAYYNTHPKLFCKRCIKIINSPRGQWILQNIEKDNI